VNKSIKLAVILVPLALLAACGGQPVVEEAAPAEEATPAAESESAEEVAEEEAAIEEAAEPAEAEQAGACEAGFQPIDHDFGETCVPVNPQRIVVTDIDIVAFMRVLGIKPVALDMTQWNELVNASPEWGDEGQTFVADAADLGEWPYNLEVMAAANPDLILAAGVEDYDLLSEIAPTVAFNIYDNNEDRWSTFTEYFGDVLDVQEESQSLIDATNERIEALSDYARNEAGNPSVSVFASWDGTVNYGAPYFAYNQIKAGADLARPANQDLTQAEYETSFEEYWANVSLEKLDTIDADRLLLLSFDFREGDEISEFVDEPIWAALEAVKNEQFQAVSGQQWLSFDVYSINKTIDDLFRIVGNIDPAEVSPNPFLAAEAASAALDCDEGFRVIESAFGATCIPEAPERIIALNEGVMANLLALGIEPLAVQDYANRDNTQYLGDTTDEIDSVGIPDGPNFEAMLALDPDLILGMDFDADEELLETLEQIAPVALSPDDSAGWRSNFLFTGDAVGKLAEAEALVATTDARLEEFRTAYAAQAPADETIAIIRSRADSFNIYNKESFIAELVKEAGLQMPESFDDVKAWNTTSLESIPLLTSDKLFVMVRNEDEAGMFVDMNGSPLWQSLRAFEAEVVYGREDVWLQSNILSAHLILDDLAEIFEVEIATPTPFLSDADGTN
jgi:iron complex transport system substrate-binding protein